MLQMLIIVRSGEQATANASAPAIAAAILVIDGPLEDNFSGRSYPTFDDTSTATPGVGNTSQP